MTSILIAALSFVVGAITGGVALLVLAAWATRDIEKIEREYAAAMDRAPASVDRARSC
jgi:hypothetical protein